MGGSLGLVKGELKKISLQSNKNQGLHYYTTGKAMSETTWIEGSKGSERSFKK